MQKLVSTLSLFTSFSTLLCCALPALLVAIGAGAVVAGLVTNFPQLVWLSEHKNYLFAIAGILIAFAGYMLWRAKYLPCPVDPELAKACTRTRKVSLYIYYFSVAVYFIGAFFAYIAPFLI